MDGRPVILHIFVHLGAGHVGHFAGVRAAAYADISLHLCHKRSVHLGTALELFNIAVHDDFTVVGLVAKPQKRIAACGVHRFDQGAGQVFVSTNALDEYVFARLYRAGKIHQPVGQLQDTRVKHIHSSKRSDSLCCSKRLIRRTSYYYTR
ncbi:hypothetical protein SDC9_66543 [bioreactor metagenome]|uniref:Uncharacterized protein n=1 Tax=bioreactor metagenome TaxID=1076179 RepID=A0A644Y1K1_9ZZZZ